MPPRFSNKAKQDYLGQPPRGQGRGNNERVERSRTAPTDRGGYHDNRHVGNRNPSDRNFGDRSDRGDRNRNRGESGNTDRQFTDERKGGGRDYTDERKGGGRDYRGENREPRQQTDKRNYSDSQKSANITKSSSSATSSTNHKQNENKSANSSQTRTDSSRGQNYGKPSQDENQSAAGSQTRNYDRNDTRSQNIQKGQSSRPENQGSQGRQDVYPKGGNSQMAKGGNFQQNSNYVQNYPTNTNYGNYNNNNSAVSSNAGQFIQQPPPEYVYAEVRHLCHCKFCILKVPFMGTVILYDR